MINPLFYFYMAEQEGLLEKDNWREFLQELRSKKPRNYRDLSQIFYKYDINHENLTSEDWDEIENALN